MPNPASKLKVLSERLRSKSPSNRNTSQPKVSAISKTAQLNQATSSTPPSASAIQANLKSGHTDLWKEAYQKLSSDDRKSLQEILDTTNRNSQALAFARTLKTSQSTVPEDLKLLVTQKRDECERRKWKFTFHGREIILRDVAEKVIIWLDKLKDIGDVVASYDPVHLALPWAGIRFLLQCAVHERQQMGSMLLGVERITCLMNRCTVYEALYIHEPEPGQAFENLKAALKKLYVNILNFLKTICEMYNENTGQKLLSMIFDPERLDDFVRKCDESERTINMEASNCESVYQRSSYARSVEKLDKLTDILRSIEKPIVRTDKRVADLWDKFKQSETLEILRWVSQVPYEDDHKRLREDHVASTGQWLLDHDKYQAWRRSSASTIVWLHGIPGAGKTKLITSVVEDIFKALEVQKNDEGFAYFYCNRNENDRQDSESVLRSLVKQLSLSRVDKSLQTSLIDIYQRKQQSGFASQKLDINETKTLLYRYIDLYPQTTFIIDALDECDPRKREILIDFFDDAVQRAARPVKIMISSRPDDDIKYRFETGPNIGILATDNEGDIAKLVRERLSRANTTRRDKLSPEFQLEITQTLLDKSHGMFQWAALQISQLLELHLETDMRDRLGKLPIDLKEAYDEIIERIKSQPGSESTIASRAFCWVMQAQTPVSPQLLVAAACQDPESDQTNPVIIDINFVLRACQNLLVIDQQLQVCRFSHLSVQEYLETWFVKHTEADYSIARVCLQMLIGEDSSAEPFVGLEEFRASQSKDVLQHLTQHTYGKFLVVRRAQKYKHKEMVHLLAYSITQWAFHVRACEPLEAKKCLTRALMRFLGSPHNATDQYKLWHAMIEAWDGQRSGDSFDSDPILQGLANIENPLYSSVHYGELEPCSIPLLAMCHMGLYSVLEPWWKVDALNLTQCDDQKGTLLIHAATGGNYDMCKFLLDAGLEINAVGGLVETTALITACYEGHQEIVKLLLDRGADVHLPGGYEGCALAEAASKGDKAMVQLLLNHGADANFSCGSNSALTIASWNGDKEIVKLLLDNSADINFVGTRERGWTDYGPYPALASAATNGYNDIIELLLHRGAALKQSGESISALALAARHGNFETVKFLLKSGADVDVVKDSVTSPLAAACWNGSKETVQLLLEHGANIDLVVNKNEDFPSTALTVASIQGHTEIVKLLLDGGADINLVDRECGSALAAASLDGHLETVKLLLDHNADVNFVGGSCGTALVAASLGRQRELIEFLLDRGADINLVGGRYGTALTAAVFTSAESRETVELLLRHGADVDAVGGEYGTALIVASGFPYRKTIELLLDQGADVHLTNGTVTAVDCARFAATRYGRENVVQLLIDHGAAPELPDTDNALNHTPDKDTGDGQTDETRDGSEDSSEKESEHKFEMKDKFCNKDLHKYTGYELLAVCF